MSYIGNTNTTQGFVPAVDYFNGNGSTTAFTLSRPVASVAQVQAVIENVPQNPGSAFTVSGSTITFTSAPPSGTSNIYVYYTSPITQVIQPGQGTVGTTQLADASITPAKMTSGAPSWTALGGVSLPRIDSSSEGGQLNFNRASDDTATWSIDSYGSTSTPTLRFLDGANVRMALDGSGNVGIGTGSPVTKLTMAGNIAFSGSQALNWNMYSSGGDKYIANGYAAQFYYDPSAGMLRYLNASNNVSGAGAAASTVDRFAIDSSGGLFVPRCYSDTTGNSANLWVRSDGYIIRATSALKYKQDIRDLESIDINKFRPVRYKSKCEGDNQTKDFIGFIADEVHASGYPELVQYSEEGEIEGFAYDRMTAVLVKAIQELKADLDATKAELAALKGSQ